jgi:hypothetical protein
MFSELGPTVHDPMSHRDRRGPDKLAQNRNQFGQCMGLRFQNVVLHKESSASGRANLDLAGRATDSRRATLRQEILIAVALSKKGNLERRRSAIQSKNVATRLG